MSTSWRAVNNAKSATVNGIEGDRTDQSLRRSRKGPHAPRNRINPERHLPSEIGTLANLIWRHAMRSYSQHFGLGIREWRILVHIAQYQPVSGNELAKSSGMDRAGVSKTVHLLKQQGFVRGYQDSRDRRKTLLCLTKNGLEIYNQVVPLAKQRQRALLSVLTKDERSQLEKLIKRLQKQAQSMLDEMESDIQTR